VKRLSAIGICLFAALPAIAQSTAPSTGWPNSAGAGVSSVQQSGARPPLPNIHPAVARIVAPGEGSISYGSGTLVYIDEQMGIVITNWHVINEATGPISVHFPDGFYSLGSVQQVDSDWDLAAIAIRKPNVTPVALASQAPRPGEVLTIAGYGSGNYRAASGRCTQYVAPGTSFPYEMVEVAVSARQGDSGGPIFNERGELAGVLFGEGHGRTSGSYCGRVRWFLTSVIRDSPGAANIVSNNGTSPLRPVPPRPGDPEHSGEQQVVAFAPSSGPTQPGVRRNVFERAPEAMSPTVAAVPGGPIEAPPASIGWQDVAGETLGEQAKSILAVVGVLAILLQALRWVGAERTPK
jgi:hypothetical protein